MRRHLKAVWLLMLCLVFSIGMFAVSAAEELHPSLITISGGQSIGDGSYINHDDAGYPFIAQVQLDDKTIPMKSCVLGVYSWDCDEDATSYWHNSEYDMVFVNGTMVGVLTGVDDTWKTSYFNVPIDLLHVGNNTITIYVGHKDHATGAIVQHTDDWLLEVKWLSLRIDDGVAAEAPERFAITLTSADRTPAGISCSAGVEIESEKQRSYVVEYSLVDKTGSSPTNNQIIAGDEDYVSGTSVSSTGHFFLPSDAPMGNYEIQATLRDPGTNEILAHTSKTFDMESAINGGCDHAGSKTKRFVRTDLQRLAPGDANYGAQHRAIDAYVNTCDKCGEEFYIYENLRTESHTLPACACGYVDPNHNAIRSASFAAVENGCAGEPFTITIVTDDTVTRIEAVNTIGTPISGEWQRQDNGDGTITWIKVYTANVVTEEQYWDVTAYAASGAKSGSMRTNSLAVKKAGTVAPGDVLDSIADQGSYTLKVLDGESGQPVSGATVVLMGQAGTTDANGAVRFDRKAMKGKGILVQKKDYHDHSDGQYALGIGQTIDVITLYKAGHIKLAPMMCNDDNIATGTAQLNTKADLQAKITVSGKVAANDKIQDYKLMQNGVELASSTDGVFKVHNSKFEKGAALTAVMTVKRVNGQVVTEETPLNIVVVSEGLGNWFNLADIGILKGLDLGFKGVPDLLGNFTLNFDHKKGSSKQGALSSSYGLEDLEIDNYTITGGIGAKVDKDFVKMNSGLRKRMQQNHWVKDKSASFDASFAMQFTFNDKGIYKTTATVGASGSASFGKSHTFVGPFGVPFNVKWNIGGGVGVFVSDIGYNWNTKKWVTPDAELKVTGEVGGSVGPGCDFANAGIYGKLTFNGDGTISISVPVTASASGQFAGEVGLKAELNLGLLKWEGKWKFIDWKGEPFRIGKEPVTFYFALDDADDKRAAMQEIIRSGRRMAATNVISDVGYANGQAMHVLAENVDALTAVQIEAVQGQQVAVYVQNDSTSVASYGHLVFHVWNGSGWSEAKALSGAKLPEGDFSLVSDGDNMYIAYVQMKQDVDPSVLSLDNLADMEAAAASVLAPCEVLVAKYDPAQQAFVSLGAVTDDACYDYLPKLTIVAGKPCVAWAKDPANSTFITPSNAHELYAAELDASGVWQVKQLAKALPLVAEMQLGELNGQMTVAAVTDADSDASTLEDRTLTLYGMDQSQTVLAQGAVDNPVFAQAKNADGLMWYQDGQIMFTAGDAAEVLLDETYGVPADFAADSSGSRSYLFFTCYDQSAELGSRDLAGLDLNDAAAYPVILVDVPAYVDGFDAVVGEDGITIALINTEVSFSAEDFTTVSDICTIVYGYHQGVQLVAMDWSTLEFLPGNEAVLLAYVTNTGSEEVKELQVKLSGAVEAEETVQVEIAPGAVAEVALSCLIPDIVSGAVEVRVALPGEDVAQKTAATVPLEFVDFAVEARQLIVANQHYLLYTVQNIGSLAGSCTMNVRLNNAEGDVILSKDIVLAAYMVENDMLPLSEVISFAEGEVSQMLYVELVVPEEDAVALNNAKYVTFYAIPAV